MSNANRGLEGEKGLVRGTSSESPHYIEAQMLGWKSQPKTGGEKGRLVEAFGKKAGSDRGLNLAMVNTNRGLKGERS